MKTEQLWFRMSANLHEQIDVVAMRMKLGWEGFGIYVGILCLLRGSENGTLPTDYNSIGWQLRCSNDIVKSVIADFGLFTLIDNGKRFFNQNLMDEMEQYQRVLDERRKAGRLSAERRWGAKTEQNSNGDVIFEPIPTSKTSEKEDIFIGDPSKNVASVTDFDALNKQEKK